MAALADKTSLICIHCGAETDNNPILVGDKAFCCQGCKSVYQILEANGLCEYYALNDRPGVHAGAKSEGNYSLDELNLMVSHFTLAQSGGNRTVLLYIPAMHCSSCIWLLEKLGDLDKGITESRTDFVSKQLRIRYQEANTSFGNIIMMLKSLGYEPSLMPEDNSKAEKKLSRQLLVKLGIAGFCAGNIMMFSFPQYLGLDPAEEREFGRLFDLLNTVISLPLVLYCGAEYFKAFFQWIQRGAISVKVPLALGIGALWLRSIYEVASATGPGYFDSLAGLIFFLLTGAWLQNRTFDALRFGESARKFFPLVARIVKQGGTEAKKVVDLVPGDRVAVRYGEIIPADGILMGSNAVVDYAFATGESTPENKVAGEILLGGGRNAGPAFEMEVVRAFDHGRLSEIWKSAEGQTDADRAIPAFEARTSRIFIWTTLVIALAALIWWLPQNSSRAWFAFTAVLMVACPCALALAPPFTWNQVASYFAGMGLFLRKPEYAGTLGEIRTIIFDKTGTLTNQEVIRAEVPTSYSTHEKEMLKTIASQSHHPYSQAIVHALNGYENLPVDHFREYPGKGSLAECSEDVLKLGGANWVAASTGKEDGQRKEIWFSINGRILEPVEIYSNYRPELAGVLKNLKTRGLRMILASGDSAVEQEKLHAVFPAVFTETHFHMSPAGKVSLLQKEQMQGKAAMVGDGLNDAGALKMADIGMVVTGDTNNFTPEASAILLRDSMGLLPAMLDTARRSNRIVKETFAVSLVYNAIALTLAATGHMSPLIAAILMPSSSIALMVYAWARTKIMLGRKTKP